MTVSTTSRPSPPRMVSRPPQGQAVLDLLDTAHRCLATAGTTSVPAERYVAAHLAALRAAAAVLAARARPGGSRPRNVWTVLVDVSPELCEWATFFAAGAAKRAAAEAGLPHAVTARESDDLLRDAEAFLTLVMGVLDVPYQPMLHGTAALRAG